MRILEIASRPAFVTHPAEALAAAAREMRARGVGALIVVDPCDPKQQPLGILTDRDIVRGQMTRSASLHCLTVGDVMTPEPLAVPADAGFTEAIRAMSQRAVRRAPVVDHDGALVGVITLDDLLPVVARELNELGRIVDLQAHMFAHLGPRQPIPG